MYMKHVKNMLLNKPSYEILKKNEKLKLSKKINNNNNKIITIIKNEKRYNI